MTSVERKEREDWVQIEVCGGIEGEGSSEKLTEKERRKKRERAINRPKLMSKTNYYIWLSHTNISKTLDNSIPMHRNVNPLPTVVIFSISHATSGYITTINNNGHGYTWT